MKFSNGSSVLLVLTALVLSNNDFVQCRRRGKDGADGKKGKKGDIVYGLKPEYAKMRDIDSGSLYEKTTFNRWFPDIDTLEVDRLDIGRNATFSPRELRRIQHENIELYDDSQMVTKNLYWHYANNKTFERILHDHWYEDEHCVAVRDIMGVAPIDFLVIPRKTLKDMGDVKPEDGWLMGHLIWVAHHVSQTMGLYKGYRIVLNYGPDSHNYMEQFHLRVLGGLKLLWPPFEPTTLYPTTTIPTTGRRRTLTTFVPFTYDEREIEESRIDKSVPWVESKPRDKRRKQYFMPNLTSDQRHYEHKSSYEVCRKEHKSGEPVICDRK